MMKGKMATAMAGGKCRLKVRTIITTVIMAKKTARGPVPIPLTMITVESALRPHIIGIRNRCLTHGFVSKCTKISNPTTTSGGSRKSRSPVYRPILAETTRNAVKKGTHEKSLAD